VKTALLYEVRKRKTLSDQERADLAASYQEAIVDALLQRVEAALFQFLPPLAGDGRLGPSVFPSPARGGGSGWGPTPTVVIGGGVARNRRLREAARSRLGQKAHLVIPAPELCTDNAAMIGAAALIEWDRRGPDPAPFDADPSLGFS